MSHSDMGAIPAELRPTFAMLRCAFPDGIGTGEYLPLLAILSQEMSHRNVASVVACFTGRDYAEVLNDVYRALSSAAPEPSLVTRVQERLMPCGYAEWVRAA